MHLWESWCLFSLIMCLVESDPRMNVLLDPLKHILGCLGEWLELKCGQRGWHSISV